MATQGNVAPVIIKRKKIVGGGGHHGGAWKVAYADFVTAMMAFFMLMWLLNATTETQRKGLADYFNPTVPISRISGGGDGAFGGSSLFSEDTLARDGTGGSRMQNVSGDNARGETGADARAGQGELERLAETLSGLTGDSLSRELLMRHVVTRVTDEGLIAELFDSGEDRLFVPDTAESTPLLRDLLAMVAEVFAMSANPVAIGGHVKSYPVVLTRNPVWDLSTARAGEARRLVEAAGFPAERIQRVTGFADRKPVGEHAADPRNNRLELVLLRGKS